MDWNNQNQVHLFQKQMILSPDSEPRCISTSKFERLFWCCFDEQIRAYSTHSSQGKFHKLYEFRPVWTNVTVLKYLPMLKYVVTLEKDLMGESACRVYRISWNVSKNKTEIKAMVLQRDVNLVDVCEVKNQILTSASGMITLWGFRKSSQFQPECILKLHSTWNIDCISLYRNYFSYANGTNCRIVKLYEDEKSEEEDQLDDGLAVMWGVDHPEVDSNSFVDIRFSKNTHEVLPSPANKSHEYSKVSSDMPFDVVGETPNVDHPTFVNKGFISRSVNLVHKHFPQNEKVRSIHFARKVSNQKEYNNDELGLLCIISTTEKGYIYDISNLKLISKFDFHGECLMSAMNSFFLFAISPSGLEVWSILGKEGATMLRFHPFIGLKSISASNQQVVLMSKFGSTDNLALAALYDEKNQPVVLSNFRNIEKFGKAGKLMPLFKSKRTKLQPTPTAESVKADVSFNVYILQHEELIDIYQDMIQNAEDYQKENKSEVADKFIQEAHAVLQCKYYDILSCRDIMNNPLQMMSLEVERLNYASLLSTSFGNVAKVFIRRENFPAAAAAYAQSRIPVPDVLKELENSPEALIYYLNHILNDPSKSELLDQKPETENKILELFAKYSSSSLSKVISESILKNFDQQNAIELLRNQKGSKPFDLFTLGTLLLENHEAKSSVEVLSKMIPRCVVDFCVENSKLFHKDVQIQNMNLGYKSVDGMIQWDENTTLGMILRAHFPWCLLYILLKLDQSIPWTIGVKMLSYSPQDDDNRLLIVIYLLNLIQKKDKESNLQIETLLDVLMEALSDENTINQPVEFDSFIVESSQDMENLEEMIQDFNFLNDRYQWIDKLDKEAHSEERETSCFLDEQEPNEFLSDILSDRRKRNGFYLLNAQGILSRKDIPLKIDKIAAFLRKKPKAVGQKTLLLLSVLQDSHEIEKSFNHLLDTFPTLCFTISKDCCTTETDWKTVIRILYHRIESNPKTYEPIFKEIMWHLATTQPPKFYLPLIPHGNINYFLPFILKNSSVFQSSDEF